MLTLPKLFKKKPHPKRWIAHPEDLPWYDQPNALEVLDERSRTGKYSEADRALLEAWIKDGYCIVKNVVDSANIDGMARDLDDAWTATTPIPHLHILGAKLMEEDPNSIPHYHLVAMDPARRQLLRDTTPWRVHNFFSVSKHAAAIHDNPELKRIASMIFDREGFPDTTINFIYGSRQGLHQDTAVFHVFPMNYLIGTWLACEDISADSGPLVYYPGSHKHLMFPQFDNYPQTNVRTCDKPTRDVYDAYLQKLSEQHERKQFLAKKGDVLFWHGMLIHGGDEVKNPALTRKSHVCHYIPEGMNKTLEIVGPFNW